MRKIAKFLFIVVVAAVVNVFPNNVNAMEMPNAEEPAVTPVAPTYIDVSIDTQTLVYYVNGVPALITPCVTGQPGRGTPRGVFAINSCVPGKYLTGPTWHVWVNRWMRFCGNCGIHDASWRKSFGGEIYKTNGSHGCVNIPHDQAVQLYSMVGVGTPVIVH
ncbi:MAG: L,D-transpeptidase [Lachnospiraceae bacterium]|nr:L,D-transpeptidase [Lachnospiraceae bacterium]